MTTAGAVTLFPISSSGSQASGLTSLAAGADGNLWFTEREGKSTVLGRMSPSGVVTDFPVANLVGATVANGLNGSLIVTGQNARGQNEVLSLTTTGASTRYKIPAAISKAFGTYLGAADGSLWFSNETGTPRLGRITSSGAATSYNLSPYVRYRFPLDAMTLGQDGNLYVLDNGNTSAGVYRIATSKLSPVR